MTLQRIGVMLSPTFLFQRFLVFPPDNPNNNYFTLVMFLYAAAQQGNFKIIEMLLKTDIKSQDSNFTQFVHFHCDGRLVCVYSNYIHTLLYNMPSWASMPRSPHKTECVSTYADKPLSYPCC